MPLLSERALEGLRNYKYKSGGLTRLDDLHQPFWNWLVSQLPTWLAPNLITLAGTAALVLAYIVCAFYQPDIYGVSPRWVYALGGIAVITYVNLDCIDGKQARRTQSSSPLGQLFDHGCDGFAVHLLLANIACALSHPCNWIGALGTTMVMLVFVLGQWEEYHTGVMCYGNGTYGVLEANYALAIIHLFTACVGGAFWQQDMSGYIKKYMGIEVTIGLNELLVLNVAFWAGVQCSGQLYRTFLFNADLLTEQERGHKQVGRAAAVNHLILIGMVVGFGSVWYIASPSAHGECRLIQSAWGVLFAVAGTQLIVAHMAKEPYQPYWWLFVLLAGAAANSQMNWLDTYVVAISVWAVAVIAYSVYVFCIISEICAFLKIRCFSIKKLVVD